MNIRKSFSFVPLLVCLVWLTSCGKTESPEGTFHLSGTFHVDSLTNDDHVALYLDNHQDIDYCTLPMSNGSFVYQGTLSGISELTLSFREHILHIYVSPGDELSFAVDSLGVLTWNTADSINYWLQQESMKMAEMDKEKRKSCIDSICRTNANHVRTTLLIREQMEDLKDSIFVRRCLGSLSPEAKPIWLLNILDSQFDHLSVKNFRSSRLPRTEVITNDSVPYKFLDSRRESLLIFFWADFNQASIDSLYVMQGIARDYGLYDYEETFEKEKSPTRSKKMHRIELMTVCLQTADSASWHQVVDSLPGKHAWIQGGFAHPLLSNFNLTKLPNNLQCDQFSNFQSSDRWGKPLRNWLENTPIKTQTAK